MGLADSRVAPVLLRQVARNLKQDGTPQGQGNVTGNRVDGVCHFQGEGVVRWHEEEAVSGDQFGGRSQDCVP